MNILFLATHMNTGGISQYILTLGRALKQRGHSVFVVSSGGNLEPSLEDAGIVHRTMNIKTKSELSPKIYFAAAELRRFIKEHSIDIVHAHTRITQVMGSVISRATGTPYISTCHGFFKPRFSRRLFPCWGEAVIAISDAVRLHLIQDFHVPESNVFLVPNGIDTGEFASVSEEEKRSRRAGLGFSDEPLIGIIARLSDVKGHDTLIRAFNDVVQAVPKARLLIVGEGKEEAVLKKMAKDFNLTEQIKFYPVVNKTAEILSLLDIFVMPSLQEGLGLAVMEAQAAGLPVVASRVGGIPSLIEDGKTGILVPAGSPDDLAKAIKAMLNDPARAREMGQQARQFVSEKFSVGKMADATLDVYESIIKS